MTYFFKAISYIFHPIIMPILGVFILFEAPTLPGSMITLDAIFYFPDQAKHVLYIVMIILTIVAPGISLLIMKWNKMISSLHLKDPKERIYPYILVMFYFMLAYTYLKLQLPPYLQHPALMSFFFGIVIVFVVSFVVNFWVKVSMHAAAVFGLCGMLLAYDQSQIQSNLEYLFYLFFVGGLVGTSRIYLEAHTLKEVLLGMLIGFGVLFASVKFEIFI